MAGGQRAALERLRQAHRWVEEGKFYDGAKLFYELAQGAAERRIPRAPQLFLQAGHAFLQAGEHERGMECLRRGLTMMVKMGQKRRLPFASQRILDTLTALGYEEESKKLEQEINQELGRFGLNLLAATEPTKRARLPVKCPQCGGTVHPQEVIWIDEQSATCDYCGSVLETTT